MTPAELPPTFEQSFEAAPIEQPPVSFSTATALIPHISEAKREAEEEKGTAVKATEVLGAGELDSADSEESEVREPRQFAGSRKDPTSAQSAVYSSSRKETIDWREEAFASPLPSRTEASAKPALTSPKVRRNEKSPSSMEVLESEDFGRQGLVHSHQLLGEVDTSQSRSRELSAETGTIGPSRVTKSDKEHLESESVELRRESKPAYSPLSLPVQIARMSGEDTTERVEGLSSSRLTAEATTERQRRGQWEEERTGGTYHSTQSAHVRVLSKQQDRRKVAAVAPAKVSQVAAFHRLQWESALRIQRGYRRYVLRVHNNKACQTEGHACACMQELLSLLRDPSILAGLRLLGGFASYLQAHGLRSL